MKTKNLMKNLIKVWLLVTINIFSLSLNINTIHAQDNDLKVDGFQIMPKLTESQASKANETIKSIWSEWWKVRNNYNSKANGLKTSEQIATWIMNWDTIMNYLVFIVQFLSQLWLFVWTGFIMYAWYKYMLSVFGSGKWATSEPIKNAIIWVIIVIFSYAILKTFTSIIGIS